LQRCWVVNVVKKVVNVIGRRRCGKKRCFNYRIEAFSYSLEGRNS
jgi:hypothetical protein